MRQSVDQLRQRLSQLEGVLSSFLPHGVDINGSTTFAYTGPRAESTTVDYRMENEWARERATFEIFERERERYEGQVASPSFDKLREGMRLADSDGEVEVGNDTIFVMMHW